MIDVMIYQDLKSLLTDATHLERNDFHYIIGAGLFFIYLLYYKYYNQKPKWHIPLIMALSLGVFMEILDITGNIQNDNIAPLHLYFSDIIRTMSVPYIACIAIFTRTLIQQRLKYD